MASYQARQRDPLLDQNMQAALERRGKELLGAALVVLGVMTAMMLASYSPDDPSFLAATNEPAMNLLGRFGAAIASPLYVIAGHGAWGIAIAFIAWGLRFITHRGEERALGRVIFVPIGVALMSVYASTLMPGPLWTHSFGLGGLFGDTILGALIGVAPVKATFGLKLISLLVGAGVVIVGAFVTGFDRAETRAVVRFLLIGAVLVYTRLLMLAGRGAEASVRAAQVAAEKARERRALARDRAAEAAAWAEAERSVPAPQPSRRVMRADPRYVAVAEEDERLVEEEPATWTPAPQKQGLLARMPAMIRRAVEPDPEPELVEPRVARGAWNAEAPSEDRIRARIVDAVKTRQIVAEQRYPAPQPQPVAQAQPRRAEPPVTAAALAAAAARQASAAAGPLFAASRARMPEATPAPMLKAEPRFMPQVRMQAAPPSAPALRPVEPPLTARPASRPLSAAAPLHDSVPSEMYDSNLDELDRIDPALAHDRFDDEDFDRNAFAEIYDDEAEAAWTPPPAAGPRKVVLHHLPKKTVAPSRQARAEAQPRLRFEEPAPVVYEAPPLSLLTNPASIQRHSLADEALEENARMLENVLDDYGVKGEIVSVRPGPVVTMYELEPAPGLKASRVIGLADDIARSMSALSARVSTVPGRTVIGIELPNAFREKVVLREILSARDFGDSNMRLPLALGKDISGEPVVANLAKMPHLLIAGTTGSGKSVAINTMILSLLYKLSPEECRLIMIDPKMLELSVYDGIPHLLSPVVTDPKKAVVALKWVVGEMEERYRKMSKMGVRNIEGYNGRVREALDRGEMFKRTVQTGFDEETGDPIFETDEFQPKTIPYIVVVVDEMADLMMVAGKEIEACIQRLAQMARASGIHLIMATQRPSVDVITGTIKANFPTRISFQVTSKIDSRTILGEQGAEQLLGMGDMLYMAGGSRITRIHGPFVSDEEVEEIVTHLKSYGPPEYMSGVVEGPDEDKEADIDAVLGLGGGEGEDALYDSAVAVVLKDRKVSTSYIQRKLGIGYNKAARLVEQMEEEGLVSAANHVGKREILVPEQ
ncbi:DNA translocase FtsK [Frigidibacter mobilis]|uniref:DNA translocase FtsK n=1 Tax=Frigidibacter mobilis TaxID=1335048 RepID=A0A159Z8K2_9RHOB|nr:DNA translocase FtsK [Frigidibacter mobilis]AMY71865.1 cell division protein FtsK [Frigidibacter mobilis]